MSEVMAMSLGKKTPTPPTVSVVIATYNRADLLPQTLQSVLLQTFADLEVIVVDDGSTDNTREVVAAIDDSRIRYIQNDWTGLPSTNRNSGLESARGRYIAFVDSDDIWLPEKLQVQIDYLESHSDLLWCFCHYDFLENETGEVVPRPLPQEMTSERCFPDQLIRRNVIGSLTPLVRRSFIDQAGFFNESPSLRFVEEWEIWLRLTALSPPGVIDQPLALYRRHLANATGVTDAFVVGQRHLAVFRAVIEANPEVYSSLYNDAVRCGCVEYVRELLAGGELAKARELCDEAFSRPLSSPRLRVFRLLCSMPKWVVMFLLRWFRRISIFLNRQNNS